MYIYIYNVHIYIYIALAFFIKVVCYVQNSSYLSLCLFHSTQMFMEEEKELNYFIS